MSKQKIDKENSKIEGLGAELKNIKGFRYEPLNKKLQK